MRGILRAWRKRQARAVTDSGMELYEIGRLSTGRPVRVDGWTWRYIQEDPEHGRQIVNLAELMDNRERRTGVDTENGVALEPHGM